MDDSNDILRRAVFLDRDNTVITDPGYIADPDLVQLLPGAADAIRMLADADFAIVVVTNQSGLARGLITDEQLDEVHERLREVLSEQGAPLDAIYYCPYLDGDEATVQRYRKKSALRKPEPGMLLQAAVDLDLSLAGSWMVGDGERDILAGRRAGCRTILVGDAAIGDAEGASADFSAMSLIEAAQIILEHADQVMEDAVDTQESQDTEDDATETGDGDESLVSAVDVVNEPDSKPKRRPADKSRKSTRRGRIGGGDAGTVAVLEEIRDQLRRKQRDDRHDDFSVARLLGTLTQMLALVAGIWGLMSVVGNKGDALVRLSLAIFLQLLALTAFVAGGRKTQ